MVGNLRERSNPYFSVFIRTQTSERKKSTTVVIWASSGFDICKSKTASTPPANLEVSRLSAKLARKRLQRFIEGS
jgi:hypothetical protein